LSLTEAESNVGLDEERLLDTVGLQLRKNGLMPVSKESAFSLGWYLGVDIMIAGSAYHVKIGFHRTVTFQVGNQTYGKEGITWQMWYTGVHEDDSEIIIGSLLDCVDVFSNEFLEANGD